MASCCTCFTQESFWCVQAEKFDKIEDAGGSSRQRCSRCAKNITIKGGVHEFRHSYVHVLSTNSNTLPRLLFSRVLCIDLRLMHSVTVTRDEVYEWTLMVILRHFTFVAIWLKLPHRIQFCFILFSVRFVEVNFRPFIHVPCSQQKPWYPQVFAHFHLSVSLLCI